MVRGQQGTARLSGSTSKERLLRAPNRWLQQSLDRIAHPLALVLCLFPILQLISDPVLGKATQVWLLIGIGGSVVWWILSNLMAIVLHNWENQLLHLVGVGLIVIWEIFLIFGIAPAASPLLMTTLWPLMLFPVVLTVDLGRSWKHLTHCVLVLIGTLFALLISSSLHSSGFVIPISLDQVSTVRLFFVKQLSASLVYTFLPSVWFALSALLIYYLLRTSQVAELLRQTIEDVTTELTEAEDLWGSMGRCAELIQSRLRYGRVIILSYDYLTNEISVRGVAGKGAQSAMDVVLPIGKGITRRAIETCGLQNVPDVTRDPDFVSGNLPDKGRELSVPIYHSSPLPLGRNFVFGALNFQEDLKGRFPKSDETSALFIAQRMAELIAAKMGYELEAVHQQVTTIMQVLCDLNNPEDVINASMREIRAMFKASFAAYFRLAAGTGYPLPKVLLTDGSQAPDFWKQPSLLNSNSELIEWICAQRPRFIRRHDFNELKDGGLGFGTDFQIAEDAQSLIFLPLGTPNARWGALFLVFREPQIFMPSMQLAVSTFANALIPHLDRAEYLGTIFENFGRPRLHMHSIQGIAGLGHGTWESRLEAIETDFHKSWTKNITAQDRQDALENVRSLREGLRIVFSRARIEEATRLPLFHHRTLSDALREDIFGPLAQQFHKAPIRRIDDLMDRESRDLWLVLYRIIGEATTNAYLHGNPNWVSIQLRREYNRVLLYVDDDGAGFDPNGHKVGPDGIFELLSRLGDCMAAYHSWDGTGIGQGSHLKVIIPALPSQEAHQRVMEELQ